MDGDLPKLNCWQVMSCLKGPDGNNTCPAGRETQLNGLHGGKNGGRACWNIAGTLCKSLNNLKGVNAAKLQNCWKCDFFNQVRQEEQSEPLGFSGTPLAMEHALRNIRISGPPPTPAEIKKEFADLVEANMASVKK